MSLLLEDLIAQSSHWIDGVHQIWEIFCSCVSWNPTYATSLIILRLSIFWINFEWKRYLNYCKTCIFRSETWWSLTARYAGVHIKPKILSNRKWLLFPFNKKFTVLAYVKTKVNALSNSPSCRLATFEGRPSIKFNKVLVIPRKHEKTHWIWDDLANESNIVTFRSSVDIESTIFRKVRASLLWNNG